MMSEVDRAPIDRARTEPVASSRTKKRIAFFISADSFEHFFGGMFGLGREEYLRSYRNDYVWDYGLGLRDEGHEIYIYILSYGAAEVRQVEDHVHVRFVPLPAWLRAVDPILYRLRRFTSFDVLREQVRYGAYGAALQEALQTDRIDLLYHQEIWSSRFAVLTPRVSVPLIGADHGAPRRNVVTDMQRKAFERAASVTCQSVEGVELAKKVGGRAVLMRNGVDTAFFAPAATDNARPMRVLTVGRLVEPQKRFSDLIQAMSFLPEFALTIVGSGPDEARLKQLTAETKVADRVNFAGFISDRQKLRALYQGCGVFVSSSAWEAAALVVLEAMSCEAPIVATRIPSFEELFTDGKDGILVPVGRPEEIAKAVRRAYALRSELGHQARETVATRYSSKALYRSLSELVESVGK
jgi:glycosyltransferase involved in cell wall biosynthesis